MSPVSRSTSDQPMRPVFIHKEADDPGLSQTARDLGALSLTLKRSQYEVFGTELSYRSFPFIPYSPCLFILRLRRRHKSFEQTRCLRVSSAAGYRLDLPV